MDPDVDFTVWCTWAKMSETSYMSVAMLQANYMSVAMLQANYMSMAMLLNVLSLK
jgi:hypothetical protein